MKCPCLLRRLFKTICCRTSPKECLKIKRNPRNYFFNLVSLKSAKRAFEILRLDSSGYQLVRRIRLVAKDFLFPAKRWVPQDIVSECPNFEPLVVKIALFFHIYHLEFLANFSKIVSHLPPSYKVFVTCPSLELYSRITEIAKTQKMEFNIKVSENRGRNFGPLLVEFGNEIPKFDYFVHLHSKKSEHSDSRQISFWNDAMWNVFPGSVPILERAIRLMENDPLTSIAYVDLSQIIPSRSYEWALTSKKARELLPTFNLPFLNVSFPFPAGGCF